jgi:hypothetical protein
MRSPKTGQRLKADLDSLRQMSEFPMFYPTRGSTRVPVNIERLEKAASLQQILAHMETFPDAFKRFKKGWQASMEGLQKHTGAQRIHQFVRALEALIMPRIGKTKNDFVHRCQTFAKASQNTRQTLEQAFDLRSMEEHLNEWDTAGSLPNDTRENTEILALHRTRQMEQLMRFAYTRILEDATLREHFSTETKQQAFWSLQDGQRTNLWGKQLDLTLIKEVRAFDIWVRAPLY